MIANLRYAARNGEKIWIGGGEFSGRELTEVADKLEAFDEMVTALRDIKHALAGNKLVNVENSTVHYAYHKAFGAINKAEGK